MNESISVLLVDDHEVVRQGVRAFVELSGTSTGAQVLRLAIDNAVPTLAIDQVQHNGGDVDPCAIVNQEPKTGVRFQITVNDPQGHLWWYKLTARHGGPPSSVETIAEERYDSAEHGDTWNGVSQLWVPEGEELWQATETCAYEFRLVADARITNGYAWVYRDVECSKYVTIQLVSSGS
jgi:hypothetical protein